MKLFAHRSQIVFLSIFLLLALSVSIFANTEIINAIQEKPRLTANDLKTSSTHSKSNDPLTSFGHGRFFGKDGAVFAPTPESVYEVQTYYLTKSTANINQIKDRKVLATLKKKKTLIYAAVNDKILANALYLDELLKLSEKTEDVVLMEMLDGLRRYHIEHFAKLSFRNEPGVFSKGIHPDIARKLEEGGITVFLKTNASGNEYIKECADAGVPIPPPMYAAPWENRGVFSNEFIDGGSFADLWFYESREPEGACLALPRYGSEDAKTANVLGLICVGKKTSKACFWDNPNTRKFVRDVPVSIEEFVGGADLASNGQGTCTACHAGENPFVVHPDKAPFAGLNPKLMPDNWHDPLVHPSWPQNPGPTSVLDTVNSQNRCDSCHQQGGAGRFPDVSDPGIAQYCSVVLEQSVFGGAKRTMPQGLGPIWGYFNHIDALLSLCYGKSVEQDPIPDDDKHISPPIIIEPLYGCATQLAVKGTLLDAKVSVFINGAFIDAKISRSPSLLEFDVPALVAGDVVTATQEFNGVLSDPSDPATVRDHKVDFPSGLPKPDIDPKLIYQCGNTIAVKHVPGAKLTVFVNGIDPRSRNTSTGWSGIYPGKYPFDLGDKFTASIELCSDASLLSDAETAVAAPPTVNAPKFAPPQTYVGQQLINITDILHGSWLEVGESSAGGFGQFSTPISWHNEYDFATPLGGPLSAGQHLTVQQALCDKSPPTETPPAKECEDIPAPKIRIPLEGENYVVVTEAVAGARIHVFDSSNIELGDGSGSVIALNRDLLFGETITVTQSIGECKGKYGYKVKVRRIERDERRDKN
jgi:hypothetical protein